MKRMLLLAVAMAALGACRPDAEESTTAEELMEGEDSVIRAGAAAADSALPPVVGDTTRLDTMARGDTAVPVPPTR
jgi:hypothetical protein